MLVIVSKHLLSHKPSNLVNIPCHSKTRALNTIAKHSYRLSKKNLMFLFNPILTQANCLLKLYAILNWGKEKKGMYSDKRIVQNSSIFHRKTVSCGGTAYYCILSKLSRWDSVLELTYCLIAGTLWLHS